MEEWAGLDPCSGEWAGLNLMDTRHKRKLDLLTAAAGLGGQMDQNLITWLRPGRPSHVTRRRHGNTTMFVDPKDKQVVLIPLRTDK